MEESTIDLIKRKRLAYKTISSVPCPAFSDEPVHFNKDGFNHLIRKGRLPRTSIEIRKRLALLSEVPGILKSCDSYDTYRLHTSTEGINISEFWSLSAKREDEKIIVVIRQIGNGTKHFFSVMSDDLSLKSTKTPKGL